MVFNTGLFSSARFDWATPDHIYHALNAEFHFNYDPCPSVPRKDGLHSPWGTRNFVNPPYGRAIGAWLQKGYQESLLGKLCVFLIPSRTDTQWWHNYVMQANEIRFVRGRIHFDNRGPAPFPSAIVVFSGTDTPKC